MSATVAYLIVVGVLLAVGARAAEYVLRLAGRPSRWAWAGSLALLMMLAARAAIPGPASVMVPSVVASSDGGQPENGAGKPGVWTDVRARAGIARDIVAGVPGMVAARVGPLVPGSIANVLAAVWGTMSFTVLLVLTVAYWRFGRTVRALPLTTLHGARVRVSPGAGPAVVGIVDPQVVVPAWLLEAPADEQRLAVAHECEHIAARDPQLLIAACIGVAVLPWHPAAWWMLARLRLAVEMDCDRRVLAAGIPRVLYGSTLIDIAARGGRLPLGAPALADHTTHLERRLIAMTPTTTPYRRTRLLAVGAVAFLTVAAACEARLPSSPEIEAMDAAAIARSPLTKAALAGDTTVAWYVDGVRMTAEGYNTVAAEDIASIEVIKGVEGGEASGNEIRITTKAPGERPTSDVKVSISPFQKAQAGASTDIVQPKTVTLRPLARADYEGLIFIDGQPSDMPTLRRLATGGVVSMEVLKGSAALKRYDDPRAANGVILVTTKP